MSKELHYLHEQWPKLICYLEPGEYPIDNNAAENAVHLLSLAARTGSLIPVQKEQLRMQISFNGLINLHSLKLIFIASKYEQEFGR